MVIDVFFRNLTTFSPRMLELLDELDTPELQPLSEFFPCLPLMERIELPEGKKVNNLLRSFRTITDIVPFSIGMFPNLPKRTYTWHEFEKLLDVLELAIPLDWVPILSKNSE